MAQEFRGLFGNPRERIGVQESFWGLLAVQVRLCLDLGHSCHDAEAFAEALEAAEAGRSRGLLERARWRSSPSECPCGTHGRIRGLRAEIRRGQRRLQQEIETEWALIELLNQESTEEGNDDQSHAVEALDKRVPDELSIARCLRDAQLAFELACLPEQRKRIEHLEHYIDERRPRYLACYEKLRNIAPTFHAENTSTSFRLHPRGNISSGSPNDVRSS